MGDKRRILYICEGLTDEPGFLHCLMGKCFPFISYDIYSYRTTIHTLARHLRNEYPDFDNGDYDIRLILRELETDPSKRESLSASYSDIILAFDFEPHHDNPDFDTVRRMLNYFSDSTDMGKLYLNYPMMQSYKHLKNLPDPEYIDRDASPYHYKELVGYESSITDLLAYEYSTFISIAAHNVCKAWRIVHDEYHSINADEYDSIDWTLVFDKELEKYWKTDKVYVLNTLCLFVVDYNHSLFFNNLGRHSTKFEIVE